MTSIDPTEEPRARALAQYFWSPPTFPKLAPPLLLGVSIAALMLIFFVTEALGGVVGFLLGLVVLPLVAFWTLGVLEPEIADRILRELLAPRTRPSDAEVDRWTRECIERTVERSKTLLDLPEEEVIAEPVINVAPEAGEAWLSLTARLRERVGSDGVTRSPRIHLRVFWLTLTRMAAYECGLDLLREEPSGETTREYAPSDITSVALAPDVPQGAKTVAGGAAQTPQVVLDIQLRSGERAQLRMSPSALNPLAGGGPMMTLLRSFLSKSNNSATETNY